MKKLLSVLIVGCGLTLASISGAQADSEHLSDPQDDAEDTEAHDISGISYGHESGKLTHYIFLWDGWTANDLSLDGDLGIPC